MGVTAAERRAALTAARSAFALPEVRREYERWRAERA